jgi:hypothetical protein
VVRHKVFPRLFGHVPQSDRTAHSFKTLGETDQCCSKPLQAQQQCVERRTMLLALFGNDFSARQCTDRFQRGMERMGSQLIPERVALTDHLNPDGLHRVGLTGSTLGAAVGAPLADGFAQPVRYNDLPIGEGKRLIDGRTLCLAVGPRFTAPLRRRGPAFLFKPSYHFIEGVLIRLLNGPVPLP